MKGVNELLWRYQQQVLLRMQGIRVAGSAAVGIHSLLLPLLLASCHEDSRKTPGPNKTYMESQAALRQT